MINLFLKKSNPDGGYHVRSSSSFLGYYVKNYLEQDIYCLKNLKREFGVPFDFNLMDYPDADWISILISKTVIVHRSLERYSWKA